MPHSQYIKKKKKKTRVVPVDVEMNKTNGTKNSPQNLYSVC